MGGDFKQLEKQLAYEQRVNALVANIKPMSDYQQAFEDARKRNDVRVSTGYLSVDKALNGGLANELYIMAAETSTGKSAFMMAMAQNIAKSGINVLYFALEMSKEEFVARGVSSLSFIKRAGEEKTKTYTTGDILYWTYDEQLGSFLKVPYEAYSRHVDEYFKLYGQHLHIVEGGIGGLSARDIANMAALFKKNCHGEKVVVFVDYLQLIRADAEDRSQSDRKTKIDVTVSTLKSLASQVGMPVFTASSVNRASYSGKVSTAAFKESGDVEYTGGVLIGWNWHGVTNVRDSKAVDIEKDLCKKNGYRKMSFDVLKYRNSERDKGIKLLYYPAYNYFVDIYDFNPFVAGEENPFDSWDDKKEKEDVEDVEIKKYKRIIRA